MFHPFPFPQFFSFALLLASPSTLPWLVLPCPVRGLAGLVGYLMCCVSLAPGFPLSDTAPFRRLVPALPCALPVRLRCPPPISPSLSLYPRLGLVSPPGFCSWSLSDVLFPCGACGFSPFGCGSFSSPPGALVFLSLKSPQYLVAVSSRCSSTS